MPQVSSHRMPEWAKRAYAAGNRPASAVLAVLTASVALQRLEATGLVVGSVRSGPRPRGTRVTSTVDPAALEVLLRDMDAGLHRHHS